MRTKITNKVHHVQVRFKCPPTDTDSIHIVVAGKKMDFIFEKNDAGRRLDEIGSELVQILRREMPGAQIYSWVGEDSFEINIFHIRPMYVHDIMTSFQNTIEIINPL